MKHETGIYTVTSHTPTDEEQLEFDKRYRTAEEVERDVQPELEINGQKIVWAPQEGSQTAFMQCPIFECLVIRNSWWRQDRLLSHVFRSACRARI